MGILASNCKGKSSKSDCQRTTLKKEKSGLTKSISAIRTDHYSDSYFPNSETSKLIEETSNYSFIHKKPILYKSRSISILNQNSNQNQLNKHTKANYITSIKQNQLSLSNKSVDKCCQVDLVSKESTNKVKIIEISNAEIKSKIYNQNNSIVITIQTRNSKSNDSSSSIQRSRKRNSRKSRDQKAKKQIETNYSNYSTTKSVKKPTKSVSPQNSIRSKTSTNFEKNIKESKIRNRHHSMNENYTSHNQKQFHNHKRNNYFYHYHQHFINKHPRKLTTTTSANDFRAPKVDMATLNLLEDMRMSPSISIMSESSFYKQKSNSVFSNLYNQSKI